MSFSNEGLNKASDNIALGIFLGRVVGAVGLILSFWVGGCQIKYGLQELGTLKQCSCQDR